MKTKKIISKKYPKKNSHLYMEDDLRRICLESKDLSFLKFSARIGLARWGMNKSIWEVESDTGFKQGYLERLEDDKIRSPSFKVVKILCTYYGIDIRTV